MKNLLVLLLLFCFSQLSIAKNNKKSEKTMSSKNGQIVRYNIAYKINSDFSIEGYSLTNIKGKTPNKTWIKGYYNPFNKTILFEETGKAFTKTRSNEITLYFTNVNRLDINKVNDKVLICKGFKGIYPVGNIDAVGNIVLLNNKILKEINITVKTIKRIKGRPLKTLISIEEDTTAIKQTTKKPPEIKKNEKTVKKLSENDNWILMSNEKLLVECTKQDLRLDLWDGAFIDGDSISIYLNDKILQENIVLAKELKTIKITPPANIFTLKIVALNLGTIGGNTVSFELKDKYSGRPFKSQLNTGEYFYMEFHIKEKFVRVQHKKAKQ